MNRWLRHDYARDMSEQNREHAAREARAPHAAGLLHTLDASQAPREAAERGLFNAWVDARSAALDSIYACEDMSPEEVAAWLRRCGLGR